MPEADFTTSPNKRREVSIDGISYSLDSGRKLHPTATIGKPDAPKHRPETVKVGSIKTNKYHTQPTDLPLPAVVGRANHHQTLIQLDNSLDSQAYLHPHLVSHPSLPLQGVQHPNKSRQLFIRQVVIDSFRIHHDPKASQASLIATLLSPLFWLLVALPWLIRSIWYLNDQPSQRWYAVLYRYISELNVTNFSLTVGMIIATLGLIWLMRHILLIVSYGLEIRKIDHRPASYQHFWWQSTAKVGRLAGVAIIDLIFTFAALAIIGLAYFHQLPGQSNSGQPFQIYYLNSVMFLCGLWLLLLAIHRPVSRFMLATTNQSISRLITRSYGVIWQSHGLALVAGLVWLLFAGITSALTGGIIWATLNYGLHFSANHLISRFGLVVVMAGLIYATLAAFAIWSQGFWALSYHWLGHHVKRPQISSLFVGEPHPLKPNQAIFQLIGLMILYVVILTASLYLARNSVIHLISWLQAHLPASINDLIPKP